MRRGSGRSGIRTTLASEDLQWRRDNNGRILERLFNVNVYYKAYSKQRWTSRLNLRAGASFGRPHAFGPAAPAGRRVTSACPGPALA
jgi:hypothetical protein